MEGSDNSRLETGPSADSQPSGSASPPQPSSWTSHPAVKAIGHYRWVICGLLLFGSTKNYMDRQVLSLLKTTLQQDMHWNEIDYGNLVFTFQTFYAIGMLLVGRMVDRLGTRRAYAIAMTFWSLASMAHAAAGSFVQFAFCRGALGFGESALFPASMKAVAEWFPKKERALATGIFNAGTNLGAILGGLFIPLVTLRFGWRWAFLATGGIGFIWLALWLALYRRPEEEPRCSKAELDYIRSDTEPPVRRVPWFGLLSFRQTWAYISGKFLIDQVWQFYLFWTPDLLQRRYGLPLSRVGLPIIVIYLISDIGSVGGGWLSSGLIARGASVNKARKMAMLLCGLCALPVMSADRYSNLWIAVVVIGIAAAAHQGFSSNLYTIVPDMFPTAAVGSVTGIGCMAGAIGNMLMAKGVAGLLQSTGSYRIPLMVASMLYLLALLVIHIIVPRLEPARLPGTGTAS